MVMKRRNQRVRIEVAGIIRRNYEYFVGYGLVDMEKIFLYAECA